MMRNLQTLGIGALFALVALGAFGQPYPNRTIRLVVPFPAGGTIDTFIDVVFNYPTFGETYKYAAYDGLQAVQARSS